MWGTVRRVEDFGAFVGFDDTRASGLVHISNISRQHVEYTEVGFPAAHPLFLLHLRAVSRADVECCNRIVCGLCAWRPASFLSMAHAADLFENLRRAQQEVFKLGATVSGRWC